MTPGVVDVAPPAHHLQMAASNRRGKTIACKVTVSPLLGSERDIRGAILLTDEERSRP